MMEEDRHARIAIESMFNASINSQRSGYNARTPDAGMSEALIAGARYNGRMSNVRRFFCLFVTFDFLFTALMWIICIMIGGANVRTAFTEQIVHYQIKTSLFDVVMAAACRFTVLILFYALLHIEHWFIAALSTTITCAFLITKVFLYNWAQSSQPVFQVLLILTSFVLVWGEIWLLDLKVIPQETEARDWFFGPVDPERAALIGPNSRVPAVATENVGHFYTPVESPDISDMEDNEDVAKLEQRIRQGNVPFFPATIATKIPQHKIDEFIKRGPLLLIHCHELLTSDDWSVEKISPEGDIISCMNIANPRRKIWQITGSINIAPEQLINRLYDDVENHPAWYDQIAESKKIQTLDANTDLVYQATKTQGNGAVGARDFVVLRHRGSCGQYYISSGVSVQFSHFQSRTNFVRGEHGVCCMAAQSLLNGEREKCKFTWILNTDLKGWIPQRVVDATSSTVLVNFMAALRKHAQAMTD